MIPMTNDDDERSVAPSGASGIEKLPTPPHPEAIVEGLRALQQRLPEFSPLTVDEERSMASVAYLDPEFVEAGLHAAGAWERSEVVMAMTVDELRALADRVRRWDNVERELTTLLKGISGANVKRRHQLGVALLELYSVLGRVTRRPGNERLRPHFEDMRRAYLRRRTSRKKTKPETPEE